MTTQPLADGELSVLKALWDLGPAPVRDVREHLAARGQDLAYNTVQTVLSRLVAKDLVDCSKAETPHTFRALVTRDRFRKDRVKDMVAKVYDGAAGAMAMQLVKQGKLAPEEIDELQAMLDALARKQQGKG